MIRFVNHLSHRLIAFSLAGGLFAASAQAQFVINPAVNYAAGTQPSGVTHGDFDGDGDVDLATTVEAPDRVSVLLNNGSGTFLLGAGSPLPASSSPQDLKAGDFDGDGDIDLAVALRDPQGTVLIMLNSGAGLFVQGTSNLVGERPRGLDVDDLDGDGDLDISVANRDDNSASVLTNDGLGGFAIQTVVVGGETRATALGDFDSDGDLDLAVTNSDARTIALFTNNAGVFSAGGTLSVGPFVRPDGIVADDLDGVGPDDLATGTSDQALGINQVSVFVNAGAGFSGPFNYPTDGMNTSDIAAADLDCDGALDVVLSNSDSNDISVLQNLGAAVFGPATVLAAGTSPGRITTGDLDADGDPDIAVENRDSNNLSVYINDTCAVDPGCESAAECDDGDLCTTDVCDEIAGCINTPVVCDADQTCNPDNGQCEGGTCIGDLNGDGFVNAADLALLLGNWGPCN